MTDSEKKDYLVMDAKTYKFLSNGNLPVPGVNDGQEFEDTKEAMNIMGMSDEEQNGASLKTTPLPLFPSPLFSSPLLLFPSPLSPPLSPSTPLHTHN